MIRAAWQTLHIWEHGMLSCVKKYMIHYWLHMLRGPSPQPAWWTAPPHAVLLHDAAMQKWFHGNDKHVSGRSNAVAAFQV